MTRLVVAFDYGQFQARIIEMDAKDKVYGKMLWEDYDVHAEWTEKIANQYPQWVPGKLSLFKSDKVLFKKYRDLTKNQWTFPLFFGAQLPKVSSELGIPDFNLKPLLKEWWTIFSGIHSYHQRLYTFYDEYGYVEYLTGRRAHAPLSRNQQLNYPIQGVEPDLIFDAMNRLSEKEQLEYQANVPIHDDLTFILDDKDLDKHCEVILNEMLLPTFEFINVPLIVEMSIGENWCDMEGVGLYSSYDWHQLPKRPKEFY
jgi:DNA polymerase I-like protein with 3'-5' exonuclease and polymerase domains